MAFFSTSFHGTRATRCGSLCLMHGVCLFIAHFSPFGRLRLFGFVWAIGRRKKRIRAQISVSKPSGTVLLKTQLDTLRNTLRLPKTIIAKQMYLYTHSAFAFPLCIESLFFFTWRHSYLFSLPLCQKLLAFSGLFLLVVVVSFFCLPEQPCGTRENKRMPEFSLLHLWCII